MKLPKPMLAPNAEPNLDTLRCHLLPTYHGRNDDQRKRRPRCRTRPIDRVEQSVS